MYLNCHSYYSLRYGSIKPEQLLAIASENGLQTLALTDFNSTSACLDFVRPSSKYKIKPVFGVDFRNGAQQQFILIAKNNDGYKNINDYLSEFLHDSELIIPEIAPELEDVFVIYPYVHKKTYLLKENEFLGIKPKDLNHLKFSKWNAFRNKLVVLKTVSFQNKKVFNTHRLLRAIDNNTLLSKLSKSEQCHETDSMLPYQELCDIYNEFPELIKNTASILEKCQFNFDLSHENPNNQPSYSHNEALDFRLLKRRIYDGLHYRYKKPGERVFTRIEKELSNIEMRQAWKPQVSADGIRLMANRCRYNLIGKLND